MGKKIGICVGILFIVAGVTISIPAEPSQVIADEEAAVAMQLSEEAKEASEKAASDETAQQEEQPEEKKKAEGKELITVVSVGDIMMHSDQIACGYNAVEATYDYQNMFKEIAPYLNAGDITVGNLEFTMAGKERGYTGYPMFNAPSEVADAIKAAGIDMVTTANNHCLDRRYEGLVHTIDVLDYRGILHTGTYKTEQESQKILYSEVKGIRIAFLAYTYGTNGIQVEKGKGFSVNYIDQEKIKKDIAKARQEGAQLVCVSMHMGTEYVTTPIASQKKLVDFLVENGADIILGGHPHVLEPMEIRKTMRDGKAKEVVVLYSQGNFISGQRDRYKDTGAIFNIAYEKNQYNGTLYLKEVTYIPTWVDNRNAAGKTAYRVLAAKRSVHMYETAQDKDLNADDYKKLKRSLSDARKILGSSNAKISEKLTYADPTKK